MRLLALFFVFVYLVGVIQAAPSTTNTTNITISDNFKAPSLAFTTRSLWTIVSSSVLTLFACICSAIHPNIPSPDDSPHAIMRRRLGIMIMALIAPELIVTWAMRQWVSALRVTRRFKELRYPHVSPQKTYSFDVPEVKVERENRFLCFLRSFQVRDLLILAKRVPSALVFLWHFPGALARWIKRSIKAHFQKKSEDYTWTQTHSFFVLMGGFMLYVDEKPRLTLHPDHMLKLIHEKYIDAPALTAKQIHDRSKGNAISKGLVMIQVAWFVMQLITRAIYHLETTQLEVGTLAFAVLNFLTYTFWWNKPLDVQSPHPVHLKSGSWEECKCHNVEPDVNEFGWLGLVVPGVRLEKLQTLDAPGVRHFEKFKILVPIFGPIAELIGLPYKSLDLRVPTFDGRIKLGKSNKRVLFLAGLFIAIIFGAIHCMAWFFAFPTYQEQVLWRMSAIAITFTPVVCFRIYFLPGSVQYILGVVYDLICLAFVILYITARAVLLVLMFTTLRNLPPDAYEVVSWTSLVPHL
ncbi:hypothetical protein BDR03DRAFT_1089871 [Suillus americanus]|nr:hypothetical protein BDR03DRAFT_1089871 [Suillus americanus]